jgi:hypothetical protein
MARGDDHVLMTGPVEFEFEGRSIRRLFARPAPHERRRRHLRLPAQRAESEVIRREAGRGCRRCRRGQHLRGHRRGGAAGAPGHPQAAPRAPGAASWSPAARRRSSPLFADMPEVDRVLGNEEKLRAASWARSTRGQGRVGDIMAATAPRRIASTASKATRAFLQVQNGCDHRCTFCIIPFGRGNSRSVPMRDVVAQARARRERPSRDRADRRRHHELSRRASACW